MSSFKTKKFSVNPKWRNTKYLGVRYREDPTRKYKKRPDRYIVIRYKRSGKLIGEAVGWETEGATLQEANELRSQIRQNIRLGKDFQSLSEKREIENNRKNAEIAKKEIKKKLNMPFDALALKYLDWAKDNKKTWWVDNGAYSKHVKKELGHLPIKDISPFHLERLKKNLRKKNLSERSIQCYLNVVKAMFNRGIAWGIIESKNPVTEISKTNKNFLKISDNRRLRFLSREDADMLLDELEARSPQLHDISLL
ncbi:MAG: phage integrase SAM-like domain-containing protein, partial [Nitrospinae bacterium]|nr:phage integrase SAM-like domain-containing protein [Nitrospinota bacterium]